MTATRLGLMGFGFLTQIVARRHAGGQESLALFFEKFARPFRLIFYLYQVIALTLTVFALTRYLFAPLELVSGPMTALYLCMVVFVVLVLVTGSGTITCPSTPGSLHEYVTSG